MVVEPSLAADGHQGSHYEDADPVGARVGLPGGGLHAYLTGDLLHPPMVPDEEMWRDGRLWRKGAQEHVHAVARLAGVGLGSRVLDVGCGLGGPARLLVSYYGARVTATTSSVQHAATARRLSASKPRLKRNIHIVVGDCQDSLPEGQFDAAISINMVYHVKRKVDFFRNVYRVLRPGGRFVLDDWMLTPLATADDRDELNYHFQSRHFTCTREVEGQLLQAGFPPVSLLEDVGGVGRGPMAKHFEQQMRRHFAPAIRADWPGDSGSAPGAAAWGSQMLEEWIAAVNVTLRLYKEHRMTYRRLLLVKDRDELRATREGYRQMEITFEVD